MITLAGPEPLGSKAAARPPYEAVTTWVPGDREVVVKLATDWPPTSWSGSTAIALPSTRNVTEPAAAAPLGVATTAEKVAAIPSVTGPFGATSWVVVAAGWGCGVGGGVITGGVTIGTAALMTST